MRLPLTLIASSVVLAACGGGGGGGDGPGPGPGPSTTTSVTLASGNYITVAQETLASHVYLLSSASFIMSTQPVGSQELPCTSGTLTRTVTDKNSNGQVDGGDSISMVANNCADRGVTLNGREEIIVNSGNLHSYPFSASATVQYVNLATLSASSSVVGNGSVTLQIDATGDHSQTAKLSAQSFSVSGTYGGPSFTQTLQDYEGSLEIAPAGGGETLTSRFSGTLSSTSATFGSKSVSVQTDSPFVRSDTQTYPTSGTATITGAAGAKIRVRAIDSTSVEISLDADANGIYETTTTKPWSEVL